MIVSQNESQDGNTSDASLRLDEAQTAKLSNWAKEPTILELKRDLEASKSSHDAQISKIEEWDDLLQVKGKAKPPEVQGRSKVQPKLVRRQAEWRYSALSEPFLSSHKVFKIDPATYADDDAAKQNELVLNWQFRTKLNRVKFIDNYVRATVDEGTCIVRLGWKRVTEPAKEQVPVFTHFPLQSQQDMQAFQQMLQQRDQDPRGFESQGDPAAKAALQLYDEQGHPNIAHQTGTQEVETQKVIWNCPTVEVLDPRNVYIDPSCNGDLAKAMFVIIAFETTQADLKLEPQKYKNLDKVNWSANSPATEPYFETRTPPEYNTQDTLRRRVVAYEYWGFWDVNGDGRLVPMVATWIGDTMIRMQPNPFPDQKLPIVVVPYLPKKRDLYGEPDAELLGENQKILGAVTRGMVDLLGRSANSQKGVAKGLLDPLNRRRYDKGQDYEYNPNMSPANGIIEHKFPELPASALTMAQVVNQDAEALTGVKSFSGGLSGDAYGDVAAGIKGMQSAADKRESSILRRLALGMEEIGEKIVAMNVVFLSEEETVQVTDEKFITINRDQLKGNFQFIVDISTFESDNAKAQDMAFMLQTCGPAVGSDITMMIMSEIADLKRMPKLAHMLKNYKPPPPTPEQQQLMQLQLQAAQLNVALLQSQIQLNQEKAKFEGARSDKTNLDYVEQETGTTHLRNMQEIESQGRANQNLAITKAIVAPKKPEESHPNIKAGIGFNQLSSHLMNQ